MGVSNDKRCKKYRVIAIKNNLIYKLFSVYLFCTKGTDTVILANLPEKYSIFPILPHPTVIPYLAHNNAKREVGHITGNQSQK